MSDCFVLYLLLTCMKKKTSGADKFTNNTQVTKVISDDPIIFFEPLCRAGVDVYFVVHVNHSYRVL